MRITRIIAFCFAAFMYCEISAQHRFELPDWFPEIIVSISNNPTEGYYFLASIEQPDNSGMRRGILMMLDTTGYPVFYQRLFNTVPADFRVQKNGYLTYFSTTGNHYIELDDKYQYRRSLTSQNNINTDAHEINVYGDDSYWILGLEAVPTDMSHIVPGGHPNAVVLNPVIQHVDSNHTVLFEWKGLDHIPILDCDTNYVDLTQISIDYVHANALDLDVDGNILMSSRHLNEITKIDIETGEIMWRWGGNANQFQFVNDPKGFKGQHSIRYNGSNSYTLFNNGNFQDPEESKGMEYQLNQADLIATLENEFVIEESLVFASGMGHMQRLDNGNTIIGWAYNESDIVLSEFDENATRVFEIISPDTGLFSYRAFKFDWQCGVFDYAIDSLDFGEVLVGDSSCLNVYVTNNLNTPLEINSFRTISNQFSILNSFPVTISPADSALFTICYAPTEADESVDVLSLQHKTDTSLVSKQLKICGIGKNVGIPEINNWNNAIQIIPHPVKTFSKLRLANMQQIYAVEVFDQTGRKILEHHNLKVDSYTLHRSGLDPGLYILKIKSSNITYTTKLLVE